MKNSIIFFFIESMANICDESQSRLTSKIIQQYSSIRFINWTRDAFAMYSTYIYDPANYKALQKSIDEKGERNKFSKGKCAEKQ